MQKVFRKYDIRGKFDEDLNDQIAYNIGFHFTKICITENKKEIAVGYDGRISTPILRKALFHGIYDAGGSIIDLGLVCTPMVSFYDKKYRPAGSIMITASHNPKSDNGFKLNANGSSFFGDDIQVLYQNIVKDFRKSESQIYEIQAFDIYEEYLKEIVVNVNKDLKIVWDSANAATGPLIEKLVKILPNHNLTLNTKVDGNFPSHHPDPTVVENMSEIISCEGYDFGFGFDGDGDRLGVVAYGKFLEIDKLLCIYIYDILSKNKGAKIVLDVKASAALHKCIKDFGGQVIISPTGHCFIKDKMKETGAIFGAEISAHIFFADKYYGYDDGPYAAMRFLEIITKNPKILEYIDSIFPKMFNTPELRIKVERDKRIVIEDIKTYLANNNIIPNTLDGIRVDYDFGWWLLRASNTEDIITGRIEANSIENMEIIQNIVEDILRKFK